MRAINSCLMLLWLLKVQPELYFELTRYYCNLVQYWVSPTQCNGRLIWLVTHVFQLNKRPFVPSNKSLLERL